MSVNTTLTGLSTTASSNGPDGTVDPPSTLDDAIRYALSFIAQLRDGTISNVFTAYTTGGTSTAYTITPSPVITAYTAGQSFYLTFNATSGASPTLQINGIATPPNLVKANGDGTYTNIAAGDIPANFRGRVTLLSATQALVDGITATVNATPLLHVNDIVNGDFRIAQAGTSFAAPASGAYDLDGWLNLNTSAAVFTVAQVAGSVSGRLARQATITTADAAVAAGDYATDSTRIEGYNVVKYVGQTFTVAGRAKVPVTGVHCVFLKNSGNDRSYVAEVNFTAANTWTDFSFTVTGGLPTAGTWNYTTGIGLEVGFTHMVGTTFQTTANAWNTGNFVGTANQVNDCATIGSVWALEKVTMNLGTVAAVSEISYEAELSRCHRYYWKQTAGGTFGTFGCGVVNSATQVSGVTVKLPVSMRAVPTLNFSNTRLTDGTVGPAVSSVGGNYTTTDYISVDVVASGGGLTVGRAGLLQANNNAAAYIDASARL